MKALPSMIRLRHALCSSTAVVGGSTGFGAQTITLVRGMALRARAKQSKDPDPDKPDKNSNSTTAQKAKALDGVMGDLNKRFGKGSLMNSMAYDDEVEWSPCGALTLDMAMGGGFPKGRIVEVYGPESSGKTTLAMSAVASVQRAGGTAVLIDAEHAYDPVYCKRAGVDTDKLILCQPDCGEMALEVVDQLVRSSAVDIIVVDSVAALTPRAEIEGEIGAIQVGAQARLMSHALRKIVANARKCNCLIILVNQLRQKVGVIYGNPEITSGGVALKYYSSIRLEVRKKAAIKGPNTGDDDIGIRVKGKVTKNKCASPARMGEFDLMFGTGISSEGCTLDAAEVVGAVQRKGSWYSYGDQQLAQGREKTLAMLIADPALLGKIEAKTREALSKELKAAKDKAANEQAAKDAVDEDAADEEEMRQLDKQPEVEISEDDKRGAQAFVEAMEASAKSASEIDGPPEDDDGPEEGKADVV